MLGRVEILQAATAVITMLITIVGYFIVQTLRSINENQATLAGCLTRVDNRLIVLETEHRVMSMNCQDHQALGNAK